MNETEEEKVLDNRAYTGHGSLPSGIESHTIEPGMLGGADTYFPQDEFSSTAGGQGITFDRQTKIDIKQEADGYEKSQIDIMMGTIDAQPALASGEIAFNEEILMSPLIARKPNNGMRTMASDGATHTSFHRLEQSAAK